MRAEDYTGRKIWGRTESTWLVWRPEEVVWLARTKLEQGYVEKKAYEVGSRDEIINGVWSQERLCIFYLLWEIWKNVGGFREGSDISGVSLWLLCEVIE